MQHFFAKKFIFLNIYSFVIHSVRVLPLISGAFATCVSVYSLHILCIFRTMSIKNRAPKGPASLFSSISLFSYIYIYIHLREIPCLRSHGARLHKALNCSYDIVCCHAILLKKIRRLARFAEAVLLAYHSHFNWVVLAYDLGNCTAESSED